MTYNGGRDIAMEMVKACNDFVLSAVAIAWGGGFCCHEFHSSVEILFDKLAALWDEYWNKWSEGADAAVDSFEIEKRHKVALIGVPSEDPEVVKERRRLIREMNDIFYKYRQMIGEGISPEARVILDRWLDDAKLRGCE